MGWCRERRCERVSSILKRLTGGACKSSPFEWRRYFIAGLGLGRRHVDKQRALAVWRGLNLHGASPGERVAVGQQMGFEGHLDDRVLATHRAQSSFPLVPIC